MSTICLDHCRRRQRGFAIVAAIFILVVLAALAGFVVSVSSTQHLTFAQDIQGARAYQAARVGVEWGIQNWLKTAPSLASNCPDTQIPPAVVGTAATQTLSFADPELSGFQTEVRTRRHSSGGLQFCTIEATVRPTGMTAASVASLGFIERQLTAVVEGNP